MSGFKNLFDVFGIADPKELEKPQKEKQGNGKPKGKKPKAPEAATYGLPLSIETGTGILTMQGSENQNVANAEEVLAFVAEACPYYPAQASKLQKKDKRIGVTLLNTGAAKGNIVLGPDTRMYFGTDEVDITSIEIGIDIPYKDLIDLFVAQFPLFDSEAIAPTIWCSKDNKLLLLMVDGREVTEIAEPGDCIQIRLCNEDVAAISKETYKALLKKKREEKGKDSEGVLLNFSDLAAFLPANYPKDNFVVKLIATTEEGHYYLCPRQAKPQNAAPSVQKYDIEGKTIALLFRSYPVAAEDFGGAKSVTEEQLVEFLCRKGHPEYKHAPIAIKELPELNSIMVSVQGSKKGSLSETDQLCLEKQLSGLPIGSVAQAMLNGRAFQCVRHPCFLAATQIGGDLAYFQWMAEKIPYTIWEQGYLFSKKVYGYYQSEAMLDLYYSEKDGRYAWYVPAQEVDSVTTEAVFEPYLHAYEYSGLVKVGQFHSHGAFPAFFSAADQSDEKHPGIYGVWGGFADRHSAQEELFTLRGLISRRFSVRIEKGMVFDGQKETPNERSNGHCRFIQGWMDRILLKGQGVIREPLFQNHRIATSTGRALCALFVRSEAMAEFYQLCKGIAIYSLTSHGGEMYLRPYVSGGGAPRTYCLILKGSDGVLDGASVAAIEYSGDITLIDFISKQ